jgi:hypothetical protein
MERFSRGPQKMAGLEINDHMLQERICRKGVEIVMIVSKREKTDRVFLQIGLEELPSTPSIKKTFVHLHVRSTCIF